MKLTNALFLSLGITVVITACHKPGCTDPLADNYNEDAKSEDFSCGYTGSLTFWAKPDTRDSLITIGHEMLRFELEGVLVDSIATSGFASTTGTCNGSGVKTISRSFVGNTERNYKYRVKGFGYETIYEGFVLIKADDCESIELK